MKKYPSKQTATAKTVAHERRVMPLVTCHHCDGSGKLPLTEEMWETLTMLRNMKAAHAEMVADAMKWPGHVTAINNRLVKLMELGFLRRHKAGKMYVYSPV